MTLCGLLVACAPALTAPPLEGRPLADEIVVALKPDKNPDAMLAEREALSRTLGETLGRPVRVITPLSSAVIIEGLANGSIDLGYLSATDMVNARRADAADLLLAGRIDGRPHYDSIWVCLADRPYNSIADLRGRPVAFASRTSTSGYLVPLLDLKKSGLVARDPGEFFSEVSFGSGYVSAVERVLAGEAEAAAVSDYVFHGDKHLTPGQKSRLRVLDTQGPVPTHVIAVSRRLDAASRDTLRTALLEFGRHQPELRDTVFTSALAEVDADTHLAPVVAALDSARSTTR
jgi:phosphonate transport system substrate-binding protein